MRLYMDLKDLPNYMDSKDIFSFTEGAILASSEFNNVILENGDALLVTVTFHMDDQGNTYVERKMVSAIILAPNQAWGQARAKELKYNPPDVKIVTFNKGLDQQFRGIMPDEEGEPIVYLSGHTEFFGGVVDTPIKREFRWLIVRLKAEGFEIIDLDDLGIGIR